METDDNQIAVLKPGTVFEKYTVERLLGRGGMGAVYLVRHNILDSPFALKVLSPNTAVQNRQFVGRFIREAKLACKIRHPNLITVHDAGRNPDNGMYYIVMDYVPGGSVRDLLEREYQLRPQEALRIVTQVANALVAAQEHHMVHRDIKPDNIMFDTDGTAKLADLGIAKSTDEDSTLTVSASIFGTPAYMSPEQAMDSRKVDSRADIYSLGIVFYEMLSGERPYRGESALQVLSQVVAETEVPDVRNICPQIPSELAELISDMTAKKLEERIPDPRTLLRRLSQIHLADAPKKISIRHQDVPEPPPVPGKKIRLVEPDRDGGGSGRAGETEGASDDRAEGADPEHERHAPPENPDDSGRDGGESPADPAENGAAPLLPADPEDLPNGEVPPPPAERKRRGSRRALFLICAVIVVLVVLGLFSLLHEGGKSAGSIPAGLSDAEKNGPAAQAPERVPGASPAPAQIDSDPLPRGGIVLLAGTSEYARSLKSALCRSFGKEKIAFRQAESAGGYKDELDAIIRSSPAAVVLGFSGKYAEDRISKANFENIIRHHADRLRDNMIPFLFVLSPENGDNPRLRFFNEAVEEVCKLKSIPLLRYDRQSDSALPRLLKEMIERKKPDPGKDADRSS